MGIAVAAKRKNVPKPLDAEAVGQAVLDHIERIGPKQPKVAKARSVVYAPATEGIKIIRAQADPLARRKQPASSVADVPAWQKRGLFKPGFTQGPRIKSAKLFTKGKGA